MGYKENCVVCGERLEYLSDPVEMECMYCHKKFISQVQCEKGHFICDDCHSKNGIDIVVQACISTDKTDPFKIANELFLDKRIHLHGPEHHVLVPSVLTAAYLNKIGQPEMKERYLRLCKDRGSKIPGGFCGYAGCCGAGVGVGIFFSIIEQTSPLNKEKWGFVNKTAGETLMNIGGYKGPRCCKRNAYIAFDTANEILQKELGVSLCEGKHYCGWFNKNEECLKDSCIYYPKKKDSIKYVYCF